MEWERPLLIILVPIVAVLLAWFARDSLHPMPPRRARMLLLIRIASCSLVLLALASPVLRISGTGQTALFILDRSSSMGPEGREQVAADYATLRGRLTETTRAGVIAAAGAPELLRLPERTDRAAPVELPPSTDRSTSLETALRLATSLFPPQASAHVILLSDGLEPSGDLRSAARLAALKGVRVHALPIAGVPRPDVRVSRLATSRSRIHEGATLALTATLEASVDGTARVRLFENGIEINRRTVTLEAGAPLDVEFERTPPGRNVFSYRALVERFSAEDALPGNNDALAVVDVMGPPLLLYVEGFPSQAEYLVDAMRPENIVLQVRPPSGIPTRLSELAAYDAGMPENDPVTARRHLLEGGDRERGRKVFWENQRAACQRCHKVGSQGAGEAGPNLAGIGAKQERKTLLESILLPNARITEGFETIDIATLDGDRIIGVIREQTDEAITLVTPDNQRVTIKKADIDRQRATKSAMPEDASKHLSPRELRDLVEYLAQLK